MQGVGAVILAAGQGKRMRSETPKVLHCAAGRPLVRHVLDAVEEAGITEVVVVIGQGADMVREALGPQYNYALQEKQLGTGDAVLKALPHLSAECKEVLVVCGDTPLLRSETLAKLVRSRQETGAPCRASERVVVYGSPKNSRIRIRNRINAQLPKPPQPNCLASINIPPHH